MFRSAATKIAHNSTLPALAGNKDLRPLQELITSEKAVLQSLQRLSADLMKSSDALRHWGAGEGDDLQDTLTASTTLIGYVAAAFSQLATHEQTIREYMKAVRSREENLDELRRRRKAVSAKSDSAEKRLSKMGAEHKSLQQQTELLNNLREQIRNMDWEILSDEARLSDFKRSSTRNWMMLKFGGLLECAEKATIVSEIGKLVIEEIPLGTTQPGQVRAFYTGHEKTEKLIAEAQRCVAEVVFDPEPDSPSAAAKSQQPAGSTASTIDGLPTGSSRDSAAYLQDTSDGSGFGSGLGADEFGGLGDNQGPRGYGTMPAPSSSIRVGDDGSRPGSNFNDNSNSNGSSSFASPPASAPGSRFGGQFSTFPLRKASIPGGTSSPPPPPAPGLSFQPLEDGSTSSFAAEVADAFALAGKDGGALPTPVPGKTSLDGPAPLYEAHTWDSSAGNGLPRGAAPPAERNPWDSGSAHPPPHPSEYSAASEGSTIPPPPMEEDEHMESDSEAHLAYAAPPTPQLQSPRLSDERADPSRHVNFNGGQSDSGPNVGQDSRAAKDAPRPGEAPVPYEHDEHALSAAAAREVAREMDALSFSPPSGPPPSFSHIREPNSQSFSAPSGPPQSFNTDRVPSPLVPPAPPFAQPQQKSSSGSDYTNNVAPRSEGIFSSSRTSLRGSSPNVDTFSQSAGNTAPSSPIVVQQPRPTMNPHSSSPSVSFNSPSVYSTPPEMPAALPLRSGSPASPSMLSPGTRTISAAAFKRSQMRSPSGTQPQGERGSLPDVSPLSLRKKGGPGLPGSPYPRDASPHPVPVPGQESYGSQQEPRPRRSTDSVQQPPQDYENSYDFISSYGDPVGGGSPTQTKLANPNAERGGSPGYAGGNFATNLERENLR
ncbi:hypothetical protein DFH11DRAFT_1622840 [Phellopilus nigrolimitatus]|nr:hypothetical protein DFH11DRAFT_1622840 [Phellopilus nigrolimitatus]